MTRIYGDEAELYDIAFDWDVSAEADWLVERLGPACRHVLEPGCGTGRLLAALAERGLEVTGLDLSEQMAAYARERVPGADVVVADMTDFDLGRRFDGATCAISTVSLLSPDGFVRHLDAMARHLVPGARYLVQQGLVGDTAELWRSEWEAERGEVKLHVLFEALGRDPVRPSDQSRSRVEILSGPRRGEIVEDLHSTTYWTPETWRAAVDASPFAQAACYDGRLPDRPAVELQSGGYVWHELVAP
ncbi:MAG: class I SAM-dependent methyltransferase [Gaiellaceae bacterium]